ncbi:MAG: polysaccharide deacetylase family protein [Solirubrobacteraceae bacterium]|nr:polysaccharide deacetylase family protein [Solirubrobacteraceae bacterium]
MAGTRTPLALTFDNLGEATELERGTWPAGRPLGRHPTVTEVLPRLLDLLDARGLRATFFVEAINARLYPDALRELAARGHEVGHHGWRHETWSGLDPDAEAAILARGLDAFAALGLRVAGFRPPGGDLNPGTPGRLARAGLSWCSPAGGAPGVRDGVAVLPFRWPLVDAYHVMDRFAALRARHGDPRAPLDAGALRARLTAELERHAAAGRPGCLVLHPFVGADPAHLEAQAAVLDALAGLPLDVRPGGEIAVALRRGL